MNLAALRDAHGRAPRWFDLGGETWVSVETWMARVHSPLPGWVCLPALAETVAAATREIRPPRPKVYHRSGGDSPDCPCMADLKPGPCPRCLSDTRGAHVRIGDATTRREYVDAVESLHGPCAWHPAGGLDPIVATSRGSVVGLVMPVRTTGASLAEMDAALPRRTNR